MHPQGLGVREAEQCRAPAQVGQGLERRRMRGDIIEGKEGQLPSLLGVTGAEGAAGAVSGQV